MTSLRAPGFRDPRLTKGHSPEMSERISNSFPGMASWGLADAKHTCRECKFWGVKSFRYDHHGQLEPKRCQRFAQLSSGVQGPAVPHQAKACTFFELRSGQPPEIWSARIERRHEGAATLDVK